MTEVHRPNKSRKQKKKAKNKAQEAKSDPSKVEASVSSPLNPDAKDDLNIGEGLSLFNPLTKGLGFADKVSDGVYTVQMENQSDLKADGGSINIGYEDLGDGLLNIGDKGEMTLQSPQTAQPVLFHSGHDGLIKRTAKKSGESFFGAVIDVLLLTAITIFTAAAATEFSSSLFNFDLMLSGDLNEVGKLLLIFAAYFLSYKILARVFYGKTLGEWSSRHQMGLKLQQHSILYPLRVFSRELVCLFSGVFLFPVLSTLFKRDIGYYFSGLQTYVEQKKR